MKMIFSISCPTLILKTRVTLRFKAKAASDIASPPPPAGLRSYREHRLLLHLRRIAMTETTKSLESATARSLMMGEEVSPVRRMLRMFQKRMAARLRPRGK
jgi:hypothetical protein